MATEAQRLMMMSLGKIQGCRHQRGGINLHKSLLVTKVLHKARTIAISENVAAKKEEDSEDQRVPEMDVIEEEEQTSQTVSEPVLNHEEKDASAGNPQLDMTQELTHENSDNQNKENVCPRNTVPQNYPVHGSEDFSEQEERDSNKSCSRCVKRRLTEVEAAVESISPKKQRKDGDYEEYSTEPMQVETTQISSLVNRFSSGFTGLLASDSDISQSHEEPVNTEVQGHTDSLLSCSTQIKESFELLARPIIALSV